MNIIAINYEELKAFSYKLIRDDLG